MSHAKHSPSSLPFKALCPGWQSDPTPGEFADRGTEIHAALARLVRDPVTPFVVNPEIMAPFEAGLSIFNDLKARFPEAVWRAEVPVDPGIPETQGTPDLVGWDEWGSTLIVLDWKSGFGDRDDAGSNLQLLAYALGAWKALADRPFCKIITVMAELAPGKTSTESIMDPGHLGAAEAEIGRVIWHCEQYEKSPNPILLAPSTTACKYCLKNGDCAGQKRAVTQVAAEIAAVAAVANLSAAEAGAMLTRFRPMIDLVAQFEKALEERVKAAIETGSKDTGWDLKPRNGARDWTLPEDEIVRTLTEWSRNHGGAGSPAINPHALASPAEVERRLIAFQGGVRGAKKVADEVLKGMSKPRVSKSLVPVSTTAETERIEAKP